MRDPSKTKSTGRWGAVSFDFYGFRVAVKSDDDGVLEDVQRDFSYFSKRPGEESALLEVISESVPRALRPRLKATLQTPRNIVYRKGDVSYVDYFGRALTISHGKEKAYKIYCDDRDLAHEITFLTILS